MADVNLNSGKRSLRVDLTPMVDLGFILISFFLFTTTLTGPKAMHLNMPDKGESSETETASTITVYPDTRSVQYEEGKPGTNPMRELYLDKTPSLREAILDKQRRLGPRRDSLTVIIRPKPGADYHELIGVLDEMTINGVKKYMIADQQPE